MPVEDHKKLGKMKIPLFFVWYVRKGIIVAKDNFVRRNWHDSTKCMFCHHDETTEHLLFHCKFPCSMWPVIQIASNLYLLCIFANVFGSCLHGIVTSLGFLSGCERLPLFGRDAV